MLFIRSKPVRLTPSGETVVRLARQLDLLTADAAALLGADDGPGRPPVLPIAVNADSLATWVLPALAPLAEQVSFDLRSDDEVAHRRAAAGRDRDGRGDHPGRRRCRAAA